MTWPAFAWLLLCGQGQTVPPPAPLAQNVPATAPTVPAPEGDFSYEFIESPNFDERPAGVKVDTIVLHHTEIPTLEGTVDRFMNPASRVSAHFVVGRDGRVVQMVRLADRAWHAGVSVDARGRKNTNGYSVGIEIVNRGDGSAYPKVQVKAVKKLVQQVMKVYKIKQIVSHQFVAEPQGRKDDPVAYPWESLSALHVKFYPGHKPIGPVIPPEILALRRPPEELQARKGKPRSKSATKSAGSSKPIHKRTT